MTLPDEKNGIAVPKRSCKPVLLSLLILVSGILIGSGATFIAMQNQKPEHPEFGPEYFSERMMRHLVEELQLTPEQQEKIEPIIVQHFEAMNTIRVEARPKIAAEIEQMNAAIAAILTEPQQKLWEDRQRRMREMFQREGFGPGRGPGGRRRGPDDEGRRDDDRRGDERRGDSDRDRDGRRPWRGDDPNRPPREEGQRRGPMGPPPPPTPAPEAPKAPAATNAV